MKYYVEFYNGTFTGPRRYYRVIINKVRGYLRIGTGGRFVKKTEGGG